MSKLIRDNKNILNLLVKKAYPYQDIVTTSVFVHYYIRDGLACYRVAFRLFLKTTRDMYTWVEVKHNLFYCLDINKLMRYNNLCLIGISGTAKFDSVGISGELLRYTMNSITSSLNNTNLEAINRMLHFYGITDTSYGSFYDFCNDTQVYKSFMTKLEEEVTLRTEQAVQNFFGEVRLAIPIKDRLISNTQLPLLRYDTKSQNVYTPNSGYIFNVDLMSRAGHGKDGRDIFSVADVLSSRIYLKYNGLLQIATDNDYGIPLGGAF
nr:MAG TPA: hypothetical protein [Bacteriophage sp.]